MAVPAAGANDSLGSFDATGVQPQLASARGPKSQPTARRPLDARAVGADEPSPGTGW